MKKSYSKIRHIQESNLLLERRFLNEGSFVASPYTISAVSGGNCDGNIKAYNSTTKETLYYTLKAYGVTVSVLDFPKGNSIKIKKPMIIGGGEETFNIPSGGASTTIKSNIGKDIITVNLELGDLNVTVKLIKQSGCSSKPAESTTQKVSKTIQNATDTTSKAVSDATKSIGSFFGY